MKEVNQELVFEQVKNALIELFDIDEAEIQLDASLYQDLDLDSIDAVDLVVYLQNITGKKIEPEKFKTVRTVEDIVESVIALLKNS
ncbi:acyl carrier protein [Vibrio sp. PP-XX7]